MTSIKDDYLDREPRPSSAYRIAFSARNEAAGERGPSYKKNGNCVLIVIVIYDGQNI